MKPQHAQRWFGALLIIGALTTGFESHALPPRQHAVRGAVQTIDRTNRTLTLISPGNGETRVFVWNDSTRFRQDGKKVSPEILQAGMAVKGYYRKEVGRFVLRELRLNNTAPRSTVQNASSQATKGRTSP